MPLPYERSPIFTGMPVQHAFFTRQGGVSTGAYASLNGNLSSLDDPESVAENRQRIAHVLGVLPHALLSCRQVHGTNVIMVTEHSRALWHAGGRPEADGMVTRLSDVALAILTADCVPVLFADPQAGVIGACHAGWRGALAGIVEETVAAMTALGARRDNMVAALGAAIAQESYEVGEDFITSFVAREPQSYQFFKAALDNHGQANAGHWMFDLPAFVTYSVRRAGLSSVSPSFANTYADDARFFSWRRTCHQGGTRTGGLVSVIRGCALSAENPSTNDLRQPRA